MVLYQSDLNKCCFLHTIAFIWQLPVESHTLAGFIDHLDTGSDGHVTFEEFELFVVNREMELYNIFQVRSEPAKRSTGNTHKPNVVCIVCCVARICHWRPYVWCIYIYYSSAPTGIRQEF